MLINLLLALHNEIMRMPIVEEKEGVIRIVDCEDFPKAIFFTKRRF